jgi:hypothetical protein
VEYLRKSGIHGFTQETAYMDVQIAEHTVKAHLREIRGILDRAAAIARAAEACSEAGEIERASRTLPKN